MKIPSRLVLFALILLGAFTIWAAPANAACGEISSPGSDWCPGEGPLAQTGGGGLWDVLYVGALLGFMVAGVVAAIWLTVHTAAVIRRRFHKVRHRHGRTS